MSIIDSLNETSDKAADIGNRYYKKTQQYYKLKVFQQLSIVMSLMLKGAIVGSLIFIAFIMLIVAGTLALGAYLGNMVHACLILAGSLFVIALLAYVFRSRFDSLVIKKISKQFYD